MSSRFWQSSIVRFIIVGSISTIINYAVFYVLYRQFQVQYLSSSVVGYCAGLVFGYFLNRNWSFSENKSSQGTAQGKEFLIYLTIYLLSLWAGLALLKYLHTQFGVDPRIANILSIAFETVTNFIGLRFLVFRRR